MSTARGSLRRGMLYTAVVVLLGMLPGIAVRTQAQAPGDKAVYGSSGVTFSTAYIDASGYSPQGTDICLTLQNILTGTMFNNTSGAVIDARGINSGQAQSCSVDPWGTFPTSSGRWTTPATILLPAGTITIQHTWIIPNFSRIVGEGPGVTTLAAASNFQSDLDGINAMVELGSTYSAATSCNGAYCFCGGSASGNPADCVGVGVRDLTLDASAYTGSSQLIGVENQASQELTFVDHVAFNDSPSSAQAHGLLGLNVNSYNSTNASRNICLPASSRPSECSSNNSGPYSSLTFTAGSDAGSDAQCAAITGMAGIRGIHGLTCTTASSSTGAGITLDGDNTTIEDVYVNGFADGIHVGGATYATQADVLLNITGGTSVTNLIYIDSASSAAAGSSNCPTLTPANPNTTPDVCDLSILHATSGANNTINDQITGALLSNSSDPFVAMYALGENLVPASGSIAQYSRYTTSPSQPNWSIGNTSPASGASCTTNGSLYSNTSTSSTTGTLFACVASQWVKVD